MVITNEPLDSLPGRLRSRLGERGFSRIVCNPAPDYRLGGRHGHPLMAGMASRKEPRWHMRGLW
jgi:hypothetical protein